MKAFAINQTANTLTNTLERLDHARKHETSAHVAKWEARMTAARAAFLALVLGVTGCASTPASYRGDWSSSEVEAVEAGIAAWNVDVGELTFYRVDDDHAFADVCPDIMGAGNGEHFDGYTVPGAICFYADALHDSAAWRRTAMHETGHALGLGHYTGSEASVMHPHARDVADAPTDEDRAALAEVRR